MYIELEEVLISLLVSFVLVAVAWPESKPTGPIDDYLDILSPKDWKEEGEIYEAILRIHPMLGLQEHNQILVYLYQSGKAERKIEHQHEMFEIESRDRFSGTYIDHIEPFSTLTAISYRLASRDGGKRKKIRETLAASY